MTPNQALKAFLAFCVMLAMGCTKMAPPLTTEEAETSDALTTLASGGDVDGNGVKDSTQAAIAADGGVFMWDIRSSTDNANSAVHLDVLGYGGEEGDNWIEGWMTWLPIYDSSGQLIKFGQVFDDGMYRLTCQDSDGHYCDPLEAVDEAADMAWIYKFSECGEEKSNWLFGFINGESYRPDPSGLGELLTGDDCD